MNHRGLLANGAEVRFGRLNPPIAEFVYEGRDDNGTLHLWQGDGRWRCRPNAEPHPFDLKGLHPRDPSPVFP